MEKNFGAGIIIGIIIGVAMIQIFSPEDVSSSSKTPQIQTRTNVVPNSRYYYDDDFDFSDREDRDFDYADYALHER